MRSGGMHAGKKVRLPPPPPFKICKAKKYHGIKLVFSRDQFTGNVQLRVSVCVGRVGGSEKKKGADMSREDGGGATASISPQGIGDTRRLSRIGRPFLRSLLSGKNKFKKATRVLVFA